MPATRQRARRARPKPSMIFRSVVQSCRMGPRREILAYRHFECLTCWDVVGGDKGMRRFARVGGAGVYNSGVGSVFFYQGCWMHKLKDFDHLKVTPGGKLRLKHFPTDSL